MQPEIADLDALKRFNQFIKRAVPAVVGSLASEYDAVLEALAIHATVENLAAPDELAEVEKQRKPRVMPER